MDVDQGACSRAPVEQTADGVAEARTQGLEHLAAGDVHGADTRRRRRSSFYLPIGVRFGKVLIREQGSWNFYGEYQTSLVYESYPGPAVKNSYRVNASYTIPVG